MASRKADLQRYTDDTLASTLIAQDKGLARILVELDNIAKELESGSSDAQVLRDSLHRTVLCAIRQSIVDRELRCLALSDDLTSLYNRRAFFALASQQLRVMRRKRKSLLVFFADVNNLKEINDHYGHLEGDLALIRVSRSLERTFRGSDILARIGGDEFAVLALEATSEDVGRILDRFENHVQEFTAREPRYELSVSIGMARFDPDSGDSLSDLLARADEAMYRKKRNRSKLWVAKR